MSRVEPEAHFTRHDLTDGCHLESTHVHCTTGRAVIWKQPIVEKEHATA